MRATIKDVAKEAGVSPATVSFILNNRPASFTEETKGRVMAAVNKLHYRPNQLAVSMVTRTTNTVGLILPDSTNPYFAAVGHGIEEAMRSHGVNVIIGNTGGDPSITRQYIKIFSDRRVDGMIIAQLDFENKRETEKCLDLIGTLDIPIISIDRVISSSKYSSIEVDQEMIGYLATKHLLSLGHRRIGCAAGAPDLIVNRERYAGHQAAMREFGVEPDPALLFSDSLTIACGQRALPVLLGQGVTAIFAFNDMVAYGIYKEARSYNLSIPEDLSVVGVDDIALSDIIQPPLTTVCQPVDEMAANAVSILIKEISGEVSGRSPVILPPGLNVRASTRRIG